MNENAAEIEWHDTPRPLQQPLARGLGAAGTRAAGPELNIAREAVFCSTQVADASDRP